MTSVRCGVFVNYRRDDAGWAANTLGDALHRRLGQTSVVFVDNRSIGLGQSFAEVLEAGVRNSAVLVALIGPRWGAPRLFEPEDWVRREIRQAHPEDVGVLAERLAALIPSGCRGTAVVSAPGTESTRAAIDALLRNILPPAQQWSGNRDRLVDLALAVLSRDDRLVYLAPARLEHRPRGSATLFLAETDVVIAEVDEDFRIIGEIRFPRGQIRRVDVVPTILLFADVVVHTTTAGRVPLLGLFRDQARRLADHLRS